MARVVLAMSGGVDSSVAAHLLLTAGHEVVGVFMRHGEQSPAACNVPGSLTTSGPALPVVDRLDHKQGCCTAADAEDARRVADRLGIPFYAIDLQREFGRIMDYFADEYLAGRTPNPCVQCNNWIKFGKLFEFADSVTAEYVATGHYARITGSTGEPQLLRGLDTDKDQSYVLFGIARQRLPRMLLPVGEFTKPEIRRLATELGFAVADKKDSQEICFVTSGRYDSFIRRRRPEQSVPGELITTTGEVVGHHSGIEGFTIGQRKGLGIALGEPVFVVRIEPDTHRVVLGDRQALAGQSLRARELNWLIEPPAGELRCQAQIRYNSPPADATARLLTEDTLQVDFSTPQRGITPGQAVVLYDGPRVLGGGWIASPSSH